MENKINNNLPKSSIEQKRKTTYTLSPDGKPKRHRDKRKTE